MRNRATSGQRLWAVAACAGLALVLGGCSSGPRQTTGNAGPPDAIKGPCRAAPPSADCATKVATQVGLPLAWVSVPSGWSSGLGPYSGFEGRVGVPGPGVIERLKRRGVLVVLGSGGASEAPQLQQHRHFRWRGVLVTEASGVPMPRPNPAAWSVFYAWSRQGHPYWLEVVGITADGPVGTVAEGRATARSMLEAVQYAAPAS